MASRRFLGYFIFIFLVMMGFLSGPSKAYKFYVGGRDGWVLNPSENYTRWAHRNRFQVNDTLFFKYKKGSDSVLLVKKEDYTSCNTKSPIQSLTDGDSIFIFDHSGPFYFISGNTDNCNKGQKLHVVVMAVRPKPSPTTPAPQSPSPVAAPPQSPSSSPISSPPVPPPTTAESPSESPIVSNASELAPPNHSGSEGYNSFFGLVLGASIGVSVTLGSFIGMV
ncbi:early nodulin-like protein 2 [Ricinus communis]|uniref:Early nodulin 55-2, putative n=1 Tax=Ricinus communis TaxID=3988 RepID=B9RVX2_RICCO|nr:early nodulin-like protein 2 [Ricinus communis]EEF44409.1 Early nodulin 55-2 precursor, putative [Ricinus communis]|eukprot:XP_002517891.1 early nodulin-like protein 2 [Ricinus communis]